jgi:glycosyltransferase involved in cell wall biosynthesis
MIIGVDAGMLGVSDNRLKVGVYWVAVHLLQQLSLQDSSHTYRLYSMLPIDPLLLKSFGPRMENRVVRPSRGWFSLWLPLELLLHPVDMFLALGQGMPITHARTIGFVYDLGFFHHPELYPDSARKHRNLTTNLVRKASHIITISESVKADVVKAFGVATSFVTVASLGVDEKFKTNQDIFQSKRPYFLYVGSLKHGKNLPMLIRAFAQVRKIIDADLYLVGSDFWLDPDIEKTVQSEGVTQYVRRLGYVSDQKLAAYYTGAMAFVSPSLVEGFCLPAVEAMVSGCPVIVSDIPTFTEVVGEAGIRVDPQDHTALARAMESMRDAKIRDSYVARGKAQAQKYSWESFGKVILSIINT